jgi:hypothetical protein
MSQAETSIHHGLQVILLHNAVYGGFYKRMALLRSCLAVAVERPRILGFIMAQHVVVSVVVAHSEIGRVGRVPLVVEFVDEVFSIAENKVRGTLVGAIA